MIKHDPITLTTPDTPVIFASLFDVSLSICAPTTMTKDQIEVHANEHGPMSGYGRWVVFDAAKLVGGSTTPNRCNQVDGRVHWFLLAETIVTEILKQDRYAQ